MTQNQQEFLKELNELMKKHQIFIVGESMPLYMNESGRNHTDLVGIQTSVNPIGFSQTTLAYDLPRDKSDDLLEGKISTEEFVKQWLGDNE